MLKQVVLGGDPAGIRLVLSRKVPVKVIQVDKKEVLIALKNVKTGSGYKTTGPGSSLIGNVDVETIASDVVAVVVTGRRPFERLDHGWAKSGSTYGVTLEKKKRRSVKKEIKSAGRAKKSPEKKGLYEKKQTLTRKAVRAAEKKDKASRKKAESERIEKELSVYIPPKRPESIYNGDYSDLVIQVEQAACPSESLDESIGLLKNGMWGQAFDLLDILVLNDEEVCLEGAYFLRAYAFLKLAGEDESQKLLQATRLFQDALIRFPDSEYLPFALSGLGMIHFSLENPAAAEGFFTLVNDNYRAYPGIPEVYYHLGKLYDARGYNEQALDYYKTVFEQMHENSYTVNAGIGFGKALYKKRHYIDSVRILASLVASNPEKVYDSPELLLSIGNANFELGRSVPARETLIRVTNLFPTIENKDMILSRIGDTYAQEELLERAMNFYRLVIANYPGGEGYIASSMGLARYLKSREEKEKIYNHIKTDFPDHTLASIAMMRLAEIYDQTGEYEKCIQEIEGLLSTHPRGLRYEAVKLMQRAYESLFEKRLKSGNYPNVLERYEEKRSLINRMESKKIFLRVGRAYLNAHLYEQAFDQFLKAYKLYEKSARPSSLLLGLGVAMDESGRDDDALKILNGFIRRFPKHPDRPKAHLRLGNILLEKEMFDKAVRRYTLAYKAANNPHQRGEILLREAEAYKLQAKWGKAAAALEKATGEFASASGTNYDVLSNSYRGLGEVCVEQTLYVKAAEAFSMALKFSDAGTDTADLGFMLGDAYQKGNIMKKAKETFDKIANGDDSIWARLAKERLTTIELAKKVSNS